MPSPCKVLEVYGHFHFEADNDKNDPATLYCNPREKEVLRETILKSNVRRVNLLNAERDSDKCDEQWLAVVGADHKRVTALMQVNSCEVRFQLDSGADVNTICQK